MDDLARHLQRCTAPERGQRTFGFGRLGQLLPGDWPDPTAFLEKHASCLTVTPTKEATGRDYRAWRALPARDVPDDDAIAVLFASRLFHERHTRTALAKEIGTAVHHCLFFRALGRAGDGWVEAGAGAISPRTAVALAQHTFAPARRPVIPHAVHATLAPPVGRQNPLEAAVFRIASAMWTALKVACPGHAVVAAEVECRVSSPTFVTTPGLPGRHLAPRVDAVTSAADRRTGKLLEVIDYKTCLGRKPVVHPSHVAQVLVHAACLAKCTGIVPRGCLLVYGMRDGTVHFVRVPFAVRDPFVAKLLRSVQLY